MGGSLSDVTDNVDGRSTGVSPLRSYGHFSNDLLKMDVARRAGPDRSPHETCRTGVLAREDVPEVLGEVSSSMTEYWSTITWVSLSDTWFSPRLSLGYVVHTGRRGRGDDERRVLSDVEGQDVDEGRGGP